MIKRRLNKILPQCASATRWPINHNSIVQEPRGELKWKPLGDWHNGSIFKGRQWPQLNWTTSCSSFKIDFKGQTNHRDGLAKTLKGLKHFKGVKLLTPKKSSKPKGTFFVEVCHKKLQMAEESNIKTHKLFFITYIRIFG